MAHHAADRSAAFLPGIDGSGAQRDLTCASAPDPELSRGARTTVCRGRVAFDDQITIAVPAPSMRQPAADGAAKSWALTTCDCSSRDCVLRLGATRAWVVAGLDDYDMGRIRVPVIDMAAAPRISAFSNA
jgi:hypothetical protein